MRARSATRSLFTFNYDPATQLQFAANGEPPATAQPGANFASPNPVIVDAEDEFGNIATTYNGPVTISLAGDASGLGGTRDGQRRRRRRHVHEPVDRHGRDLQSPGLEPRSGDDESCVDFHLHRRGRHPTVYHHSNRRAPCRPAPASASRSGPKTASETPPRSFTGHRHRSPSPLIPADRTRPEWPHRDRRQRRRDLQRSDAQQGRPRLHAQSHQRRPYLRDDERDQRHERSGRPSRHHARG